MGADTNSITGLVLHFRTPQKTLACLHSLRKEGISRAVVIDNSEDGGESVSSMSRDLELLRDAGISIDVLSPGRNLGFASGVNTGLAHIAITQPSHVLLINSDAQLEKGSLSQMRLSLKNASIIAPRIAQGDRLPTSPFSYYDRLFGFITSTPKLMPLRYASGCCLLIHSDQIHQPLFDQDFFFYGEDAMLGLTAEQRNIREQECSHAIALHATSSSSRNGSLFYEYHMNRAHWLLGKKLARNPLERFLFLIARCITLPMRALVRSLRFHSLVAWHGLFLATLDVMRGKHRSLTPPPSITSEKNSS